ncbi:hypothetical protein AY601_0013 [Pedobacter cryoconitis]|uniref:Uncharacterized protein n=1 Tax=Pedobacter cryoconitis TaxID=188932 RepID=A0A127V7N5_9SPHI|nr:hypothetical protein AY601_0013 [Pedobacter cryoconitis]
MYFELVRVYLATFVNDISLMNFSAAPHGCLLYVAMNCFAAPHRFSLVSIALSTSVVKLPVFVGTAKVEIFFVLSSFFFFIFRKF